MKKIIPLVLLMFAAVNALDAQFKSDSLKCFAGINPVAPFTSLQNQFANLYLPLASNLETGLALNAGIISVKNTFESRLSYGKPNSLYNLFQIHLGYNRFISKENRAKGFYIGSFIKYYRIRNKLNYLRHSGIIPYLCIGYRFEKRNMFMDCRLNQNIYSVSWSNQENTSVNSDFYFSVYDDISPVLPYLCVNIGYVFTWRKN